ncbi:MAG: tripartite tricarboxylate transporter permease, partial [Planctomycetota bacterium]|nr:tripartite tricarboxylate transporter permease [Planctomycetota bacterium]
MSQAEAVYAAFQQVFTPICLLAIFLGSLWGIIIGALPGLGSILAITIAIPFTYSLGQAAAIALLLGVYCGSVYGGCISAILINTPGTPASAATCFDGFPMAQQGKAAEALGWATGASVIGGLFSCVVLILCGPRLADFAMQFGPIETFALILMALTCIGSISTGNIVAGLFSGIVGLFIVIIGADPISGDMRFTFGIFRLSAGFDLVSVVVGIFALSEVLSRAAEYITGKPPRVQYTRMRFAPPHEWWRRRVVLLKACVIGSAVGIMPGTGSSTAAFLAYAEAKRSSPNRANMGKGEPDGVIASEASNNAVTGGALVPTLALGLPGDGVTAVMLATLVLHGITPGFRLMTDNPVTVYAAFIALFLANLVMAPQGALVARLFAKLVRIPEPVLMGMVVIMCLLGTYGIRSSAFDLFVTLGMGVFGFIFRAFGMPIAPLVIGMVLGTQFEMSLRQGLLQTRGSFSAFFYGHPIAVGLFILAGIILAGPFAKAGYSKWRMR